MLNISLYKDQEIARREFDCLIKVHYVPENHAYGRQHFFSGVKNTNFQKFKIRIEQSFVTDHIELHIREGCNNFVLRLISRVSF